MQNIVSTKIGKKIENKKLLAAVSGGVDSMVMLWIMLQIKKDIPFQLEVIHINHNLRGDESDGDEQLVVDFCKKNNIKCKVESKDVNAFQKANKQTLEQAARVVRHNAINEYKLHGKFDYVLFAHNSDDQAETVLMHIARGGGLKGATGMKEKEDLIRPLIQFSKSEIYKYAKENQVPFREDSSNASLNYTRNFLRHEIFSKLEEVYPNIKENLIRFAKIAKEDDEYIEGTIDYSSISYEKDCIRVKNEVFNQSAAVFSRIIKKVLNDCRIYFDIESKHIQAIKQLSLSKNGNYLCLPHGLYVHKEYDYVVFSTNKPIFLQEEYKNLKLDNKSINDYDLLVVDINSVKFGDGNLYFDFDKIPESAIWRVRKDGDVFHKLGSGTKKFSDVLIDKKIPLRKRKDLIVLAENNKILLAPGIDISDDVKVTKSTKRIGKLVCNKVDNNK